MLQETGQRLGEERLKGGHGPAHNTLNGMPEDPLHQSLMIEHIAHVFDLLLGQFERRYRRNFGQTFLSGPDELLLLPELKRAR